MLKITSDLVKEGHPPMVDVMSHYENKGEFIQDLESYFQAGVVISTPTFFVMGKPVDSSIDPRGQWYAKNPDAWFVKLASGKGAMRFMTSLVKPLSKVIFSRFKNGQFSDFKTYDWKKLTRRIK